MKTPKVILKGLVSGRVKLTPELLEALKKHQDSKATAKTAAASFAGDSFPMTRRRHHMIFASPLAGRWIRYSGLLLVCAGLLLPLLARATEPNATFDEANRAFAEGNISAAARGFQSMLAVQGYSAPLLFNLANAQFRDGQIGPAILNYERAQWLAPNDPDIAANLDFARRKAGLPTEAHSRMQSVLGIFSLNTWSVFGAVAILVMTAVPLLKRVLPAQRVVFNAGTAIADVAFLIAAGGVASRWTQLDRAVITARETAARVSPVTVVPPLFTLHAGETVTLKRLHGAFALIETSEGHEGWVSRDAAASVVPADAARPSGGI